MVLSLPDLWWARQQGPGLASPISMESGTSARWRALVLFIALAAESVQKAILLEGVACIVVMSESGNQIVGALTRAEYTSELKGTHPR